MSRTRLATEVHPQVCICHVYRSEIQRCIKHLSTRLVQIFRSSNTENRGFFDLFASYNKTNSLSLINPFLYAYAMQFLVSLKFGISLVVSLTVICMIFFQRRHKHRTRKILRASRRPGIVIKFWRQIVRDADLRHDVTKSRRRERSRRFVSSLIKLVERQMRRKA